MDASCLKMHQFNSISNITASAWLYVCCIDIYNCTILHAFSHAFSTIVYAQTSWKSATRLLLFVVWNGSPHSDLQGNATFEESSACRKLTGNTTLINHNSHGNNRAILCVTLLKSMDLVPNSTEAELWPSLFLKRSHANVLCNQHNLLTNKEEFK